MFAESACSGLYGVQKGDPNRNSGFPVSTFFLALCIISSPSKSHAPPSVSWVVKSRANPARTSLLGIIFVVFVTLGELWISDTMAFNALLLSLVCADTDLQGL